MFVVDTDYNKEPKTKAFSVRLPIETIKILDSISKDTKVNRNQIINQMIEYALENM